MTDDQRNALRTALQEVHDRVHALYPRCESTAEAGAQDLRHRLLVVDLAVHLADEVIAETVFDKAKVVERTANLLYAIRLVAPEHPLRKAAELLLADANAAADD